MPETTRGQEVNQAQPPTLNHVIGNRNTVERLRIALEATYNQGGAFPHVLMLGPQGLGKTLLAHIIARELGMEDQLTVCLGQAIANGLVLNGLLFEAEHGILFIDELHSLPPVAQLQLLKAMDERKVYLSGVGGRPHEIELGRFTLLAATTEEYGILPPLLDRFRLLLRMEFYSDQDLCEIVDQRAKALGWTLEEGLLMEIARRGRQTPRLALRLLESAWRTCAAENGDMITFKHFLRTMDLESLDSLGLDHVEQKYLRILRDSQGQCRLNVIASQPGLPIATVQGLEHYLIRRGLTTKDESGVRVLTPEGRSHIEQNSL